MMPIEKQVTNLELSLTLRKLGSPQESIFYWVKIKQGFSVNSFSWALWPEDRAKGTHPKGFEVVEIVSAFTCSELFEILPNYVEIRKNVNGYQAFLFENHVGVESISGTNPANCLAEVKIWFLEQGILNPERLTP